MQLTDKLGRWHRYRHVEAHVEFAGQIMESQYESIKQTDRPMTTYVLSFRLYHDWLEFTEEGYAKTYYK